MVRMFWVRFLARSLHRRYHSPPTFKMFLARCNAFHVSVQDNLEPPPSRPYDTCRLWADPVPTPSHALSRLQHRHLSPHLFLTGQDAYAFDQPLSFDASQVTDMTNMFWVRFPARLLHLRYSTSPPTLPAQLPALYTNPSFRACWGPHCWNRGTGWNPNLYLPILVHVYAACATTPPNARPYSPLSFGPPPWTLPRMNVVLFMRPTFSSAERKCFVQRQQASNQVCLGGQLRLPKHRLL